MTVVAMALVDEGVGVGGKEDMVDRSVSSHADKREQCRGEEMHVPPSIQTDHETIPLPVEHSSKSWVKHTLDQNEVQ